MKNRQALILLAIVVTALIATGVFMLWQFSRIIPEDTTRSALVPQTATNTVAYAPPERVETQTPAETGGNDLTPQFASTTVTMAFQKDGRIWQRYKNAAAGIEISYPSDAEQDVEKYRGVDLGTTAGQEERNFWLGLGKEDTEPCTTDPNESAQHTREKIAFNGIDYCLDTRSEGGMSQIYTTFTYVPKRNTSIAISFLIHGVADPSLWGDCTEDPAIAHKNGWQTEACKKYLISDEDTAVFNEVLKTVKLFPPSRAAQAQSLIVTKILKGTDKYYDYSSEYPVIEGYGNEDMVRTFDDKMSYDAATSVAAFKDYYSDPGADFSQDPGRGFMDETYSTVPFDQILNVIFTGEEYSGGAHPMTVYRTYVFDFNVGEFLTLTDLFKPRSDYLGLISNYSINALDKLGVGDADWIKSGAAADDKNFQFFSLQQDGLHIIFPPYQVASYAEGPQEVIIPFAVLRGTIQDKYLPRSDS